jgi:hypothetical protein
MIAPLQQRNRAQPPPSEPERETDWNWALEDEIERQVAERCKAQIVLWKFRLIVAETGLMGVLVVCAGVALDQPTTATLRAALLVSGSCFGSGLLCLGLSGLGVGLAALFKRTKAP